MKILLALTGSIDVIVKALTKELQVLGETAEIERASTIQDLETMTDNNVYDAIVTQLKFAVNEFSTTELIALREKNDQSVLIVALPSNYKGGAYVEELFRGDVRNCVFGKDGNPKSIVELCRDPRTRAQARLYYGLSDKISAAPPSEKKEKEDGKDLVKIAGYITHGFPDAPDATLEERIDRVAVSTSKDELREILNLLNDKLIEKVKEIPKYAGYYETEKKTIRVVEAVEKKPESVIANVFKAFGNKRNAKKEAEAERAEQRAREKAELEAKRAAERERDALLKREEDEKRAAEKKTVKSGGTVEKKPASGNGKVLKSPENKQNANKESDKPAEESIEEEMMRLAEDPFFAELIELSDKELQTGKKEQEEKSGEEERERTKHAEEERQRAAQRAEEERLKAEARIKAEAEAAEAKKIADAQKAAELAKAEAEKKRAEAERAKAEQAKAEAEKAKAEAEKARAEERAREIEQKEAERKHQRELEILHAEEEKQRRADERKLKLVEAKSEVIVEKRLVRSRVIGVIGLYRAAGATSAAVSLAKTISEHDAVTLIEVPKDGVGSIFTKYELGKKIGPAYKSVPHMIEDGETDLSGIDNSYENIQFFVPNSQNEKIDYDSQLVASMIYGTPNNVVIDLGSGITEAKKKGYLNFLSDLILVYEADQEDKYLETIRDELNAVVSTDIDPYIIRLQDRSNSKSRIEGAQILNVRKLYTNGKIAPLAISSSEEKELLSHLNISEKKRKSLFGKTKKVIVRQGTEDIAVIGTEHGVGTTHTAFMIADSLRVHYKVALVELNTSEQMASLARELGRGKNLPVKLEGIDMYHGINYSEFADRYRSKYDFVVVDFGVLKEAGKKREALALCGKKFLVFDAAPWKLDKLDNIIYQYISDFDEARQMVLLAPGADAELIRNYNLRVRSGKRQIRSVPLVKVPLKMDDEIVEYMQKLVL